MLLLVPVPALWPEQDFAIPLPALTFEGDFINRAPAVKALGDLSEGVVGDASRVPDVTGSWGKTARTFLTEGV